MNPRLKVGLLLKDASVPDWASRMVERICASDYAEIVLLVMDQSGATNPGVERLHDPFLYGVYRRFDRAVNKGGRDPLASEQLPAVLSDTAMVHVERSPGSQRTISEETAKRIREMELDVLIDIAGVTSLKAVSSLARYGVLSFSSGDGESYGGMKAGFWEIFDGVPVTSSSVKRCADNEATVVYRSRSTTMPSVKRNLDQEYLKGISFVPRVLEALYVQGEAGFSSFGIDHLGWNPPDRPGPGSLNMIGHCLRRASQNANFLARRMLFEERWAVRYKLGNERPTTYDDFVTLVPPPHTWWADPQVARQDDRFYIFIEDLTLPRSRHHAHISVITVDEQGGYTDPVPVLERPYHLSFPFVFEWKGAHYMVPESGNARTIELYEATEFPFKWRPVKTIRTDVHAVDNTLVRRDGRWWMFCNIKENEGGPINDELFLFHTDDLLSDHWVSHPMNPIVTDVSSARPAGAIFENNGMLYRPSQDSSRCYGYAVKINRILEMDERRYREVCTEHVGPELFPGASRVHTFSHIPGITVVDTYMARCRLVPGR